MFRCKKISLLILSTLTFFSVISCSEDTSSFISSVIEETTTLFTTHTITTDISTDSVDVYDYVTYSYSEDVTEDQKFLFESENETFLLYLIHHNILIDQKVNYYISNETYNYYNFITKTLWLYIEDFSCKDNIFNTIIAISDPLANYGLMYGLANYISKDLSYDYQEQVNPTSSMITFLSYKDNLDYFDITYPCFYDEYANGTQKEYSYEFAIQISDYIIGIDGLTALVNLINENEDLIKFENDFTNYKNQWLVDNGSNLVLVPSENPIVFAQGSLNTTLEWKTKHAYWILDEDFTETSLDLANYCLDCGYKSLVFVITQLEEDMNGLDQNIKMSEFQYPDLEVYFTSNISSNGLYSKGSIYVKTLYSFTHEYVHYLTTPTLDSTTTQVMREWLACYFSYNTFFNQYINEKIITHRTYINEIPLVEVIESYYNRPYDYNIDYFTYVHIKQYEYGEFDSMNILNTSYFPEYYSFPAYFIELYSEEVFLEIMRNQNLLYDYTGETWEQIFLNWEEYILTNYSWSD